MKTQLFWPPPLYWWHKRGWRESTVAFRHSGFFCASGSAVISSTVTHSSLSHRELFLDDFFQVASNEVIDKSKFLTSRLSASCVFKRTLAIPPSASGPPPLCGSDFYSFSAWKCWQKSLLGWSSFYNTLHSSRFLVWRQFCCPHIAENCISTATFSLFSMFLLIIVNFFGDKTFWPSFFCSSF